MTHPLIPPPPQTGRQPPSLNEQARYKLLHQRHDEDRRDPFAIDPHTTIRQLGRVLLRRPSVDGYFALGDLCVGQSLTDDGSLLIIYLGKGMLAYRRAFELAQHDIDRVRAERARAQLREWAVNVARLLPTPRNLATALWTLTDDRGGIAADVPGGAEVTLLLAAMLRPQPATQTAALDDQDRTSSAVTLDDAPGFSEFTDSGDGTSALDSLKAVDALLASLGTKLKQTAASEMPTRGDDTVPTSRALLHDKTPVDPLSPAKLAIAPNDPTDSDYAIGDRIGGRYEVVTIKGGGMGIVYLCYDHHEREPIALKTFRRSYINNERARMRFEQEASAWMQMDKHPNVVRARLFKMIDGCPFIFLEHISPAEGVEVDLRSWITRRRLTLKQTITFALHIALGMQHACRALPGLVHRDLKSANILVTHDGIAKVTDFGLVRTLDMTSLADTEDSAIERLIHNDATPYHLTRAGFAVGTLAYMSPEQWQAQDGDARSDIYSFGCLLYEMLTGGYVFKAEKREAWMAAHLTEQPTFDPVLTQSVTPDLHDLVLRCLAKAPDDRPQTWAEIIDALSAIYRAQHGEEPTLTIDGDALAIGDYTSKGYSLAELRHYDEALAAYERALALQPDHGGAWTGKARTLRLLGRFEEALPAYQRATALMPENMLAWRGYGLTLERLDRFADAYTCHQRAITLAPYDVWNWHNQADVLHHMGDVEGALSLLDNALEIDPTHPNSWAKIGQIRRSQGQFEAAIAAYRQAIAHKPDYGWAHNGLGLCLRDINAIDEALRAFRSACMHQPGVFWHWYNAGDMFLLMRLYNEAEAYLQRAVKVDPDMAIGWIKLGLVLRYLNRYEDAIAAYDHALAIAPGDAWALSGRGIVLERLDRLEEALICHQQAAAIDTGSATHTYNQGVVLSLLGRDADAAVALENALTIDPDHVNAWARLGKVYRQLGRLDEALHALTCATDRDPLHDWAWREQAAIYQALDRPDDALVTYARASSGAPQDTRPLLEQADLLLTIGRWGEAYTICDRALAIDGRLVEAWHKRGVALRLLKQHDEALRSLNRALEVANDQPGVSRIWTDRGIILLALDRAEDALTSFRRAADRDPDDQWIAYHQGEALIALGHHRAALDLLYPLSDGVLHDQAVVHAKIGQALRRLNRPDDALHAYDRALTIDPTYAYAHNGQGMALEMVGKLEAALDAHDRAITLDPTVNRYHTSAVDVLLALDRTDDALVRLNAALIQLPNDATLWARIGQVYRRQAKFDAAASAYEQALRLDPAYAWAWNGYCLVLGRLNRWYDARDAGEYATLHGPDEAWNWYNLGEACLMLDDCPSAQDAFTRALHLKPDHVLAKQKLEAVRRCFDQQNGGS